VEQLIEMRTTPLEMGFRVQHAKYEIKTKPSSFDMKRTPGSLEITSKNARMLMDSSAARSSMGLKTVAESVQQYAQAGIAAANNATANFAKEGNMMLNYHQYDNVVANIAQQRMDTSVDTALGFSPSVPVNITWEPSDLDMRYKMDKLNFEWHTNQTPEVEYVPSKIEYYISSYPKIEFTYVGKPIYVPPSAEPGYKEEPFDMLV
jgi:hypothetical protein